MTDIYNSSSGPKVIKEMNPHNLAAALAKLQRDFPPCDELEGKSLRQAEIDAMGSYLAVLAEAYAESQVSE